jgi:uridine kinase
VVRLDDFHNPREVRYAGEDQAENYYNRSFDIRKIVEELLAPARRKGKHAAALTLLDPDTDEFEIKKEYSFDGETIVLFEGVFLFRKELAPYIDYKICLDITFEESKRRSAERDAEAIINKYDTKYLPAQAKYLKEYPPEKTSDMVIDNNDREYPRLSLP